MDELRIAQISNRIAKDAPLNLRAWHKKTQKFLKWAERGLKSFDERLFKDFSKLLNRISDVDDYAMKHTDKGMDFTSDWNIDMLTSDIDDYRRWTSLMQGEGNFSRALRFVGGYDVTAERIEEMVKSFQDIRNVGYETLRQLVDEDYGGFTRGDMSKYKKLAGKVDKFFDFFEDVESARLGYVENLKTMAEWGGREGPKDRSKVDKLYHTTVAKSKIKSQGFKTNFKTKGLGGGTDNMISTTLSKKVAVEIANALRKMIKVANGDVNLKTIAAWAKKAGIWDDMLGYSSYQTNVMKNFGEGESIKMIDRGYVMKYYSGMNMPKVEEMPSDAVVTETRQVGDKEIVRAAWIKDKKGHDDLMFSFFRHYLSAMEFAGKGYDPLFAFVDLDNFKNLKVNEVGTFEMEVDMSDPRIKYVPGMYEYRVPPDAIQSIREI